jgi:hypothetical protein
MHSLTAVVAGLAVVGTTGCATKGYVGRVVDERSRVVDERTRAVEKRVADVERVAQDAVSRTAEYEIPGTRPPGCYTVSLTAFGRQCNPHGVNGGASLATMWMIDQDFGRRHVARSISVVDKP